MTPQHFPDRILRVLDHIQASLDGDITPAQLASVAALSPHHFHRVFVGMVGETVMSYVRRLRLERAAFRLRHVGGDITPVALLAGYDSHEAFTRAFRAHFGMPPSAYRTQAQAMLPVPQVVTRRQPAQRLLARRIVGAYDACAPAWEALMEFVLSQHPPITQPEPTLGLVYDDPDITAPEKCRYDAAVVLPPGVPAQTWPDGFIERTLPEGFYAVTVHTGPYHTILDTYVALLGHWLPRQNHTLADEPVVERYIDAPGSVPEAEQRTEVCVRLL